MRAIFAQASNFNYPIKYIYNKRIRYLTVKLNMDSKESKERGRNKYRIRTF